MAISEYDIRSCSCSSAADGQNSSIVLFLKFFFFLTQAAHLSFHSLKCSANGVFMQVMAADDFPFGKSLLFFAFALSKIDLSAVSPG